MGTPRATRRNRPASLEQLESRQLFAAATPLAVPAGSAKLTGTVLGTAGSYLNKGNTVTNAVDGNAATFFDAPVGSGAAWAGLDLGSADRITQVQFVPRSGYAGRMVGGVFQGANAADFSDAVTLVTVAATPASGRYTAAAVADGGAYQYVRYLAPATASGNVAEVEFDGVAVPTVAPVPPTTPIATVSGGVVGLSWSAGSSVSVDSYAVQRQGPTDAAFVTIGTTATPTFVDASAVAGTTYTYQVIASNAVGSTASATVTVPVPVAAVDPWSDADVGSPAKAGASTVNADGSVTVVGGGADIWNATDQFHFASQALVGNGTVVAQVTSQSNTNGWAKAGVMVRETTNADSRFALLAVTPGNGITWQVRSATHCTPSNVTVAGKAGAWLRIVRAGSTFTGQMSVDGGVTWTTVGTATVPMVNNVLAGLAVTAHDNTKASTAVFANAAVTATGTAASVWSAAASGPMDRWESETFTYNDKLYVFGGFIDRNLDATAEGDVYDPAANAWTDLTTVPAGGLTHASVTVVGDTAYFAGGTIGTFTNHQGATSTAEVLTYDLATNTWGSTTPLPAASSCGGLVCINNVLYYYGGLNAANTADLSGTWALGLSNPSVGWVSEAALPTGRNHIGAVAINGTAYAVGGWHVYDTIHGNVAEVDAYDPVADAWTKVASLPVPLGSIETSTTTADGKIIVVGGGTNGGYDGLYQNTVLVYDPATNQWSTPVTLPEANEGMSVAYVGNELVVAQGTVDNQGGWSQNQVWTTTVAI